MSSEEQVIYNYFGGDKYSFRVIDKEEDAIFRHMIYFCLPDLADNVFMYKDIFYDSIYVKIDGKIVPILASRYAFDIGDGESMMRVSHNRQLCYTFSAYDDFVYYTPNMQQEYFGYKIYFKNIEASMHEGLPCLIYK